MSDNERSGPTGEDDLSLPKGILLFLFFFICVYFVYTYLVYIYIATVQKLINEMMPDDIICSKDTRDLLIDCCVGKFFFRL